eukprot:1140729-Pelagomonas_calceolata.AAC.4
MQRDNPATSPHGPHSLGGGWRGGGGRSVRHEGRRRYGSREPSLPMEVMQVFFCDDKAMVAACMHGSTAAFLMPTRV